MSVYDPKKVVVTWGPLILDGFAEGDMVSVAWQGDGAQATVGTGGEACTTISHDDRAEVAVSLMRTGAGQNTLAALMASYNFERGLALPFAIASVDTGEVFVAGSAVIKKPPEASLGNEAPTAEVMFVIERGIYQVAPAL